MYSYRHLTFFLTSPNVSLMFFFIIIIIILIIYVVYISQIKPRINNVCNLRVILAKLPLHVNYVKFMRNLPNVGNFEFSQNFTLLLTVTLSNVDRFSTFFHCYKKNYSCKKTQVIFNICHTISNVPALTCGSLRVKYADK